MKRIVFQFNIDINFGAMSIRVGKKTNLPLILTDKHG